MKQLFKFGSGEKKKNPAFNSKGYSPLATVIGLLSAVVVVSTVWMLTAILNNVSDINTGNVADGRLSTNVAKYNDNAPKFKHAVKAPGFVGNLYGIADQANAFAADPSDCFDGFATAISINGDLGCSSDGSHLTGVEAETLQGRDYTYFQNAGNLDSGTISNNRLSSSVTLSGNSFNGSGQLVQLNSNGLLPVLDASNLYALNASNVVSGTLADARLSSNVAKYNDANPAFVNGLTAPTFTGALIGNATTATALAADPADCVMGSFANAISSTGDLTCSTDGASLVNLDATNITTGTLDDARLSTNVTMQGNVFNGASQLVQLDATGALPALDGANLTNLTGANVTGTVANATTAVNFTGVLTGDVTGTQDATVVSNVGDSALSLNVALLDGTNGLNFSGSGTLTADSFTGDGSALTNLTGANVTGAVANATTAVDFTGVLAGDVTGTQGLTVVSNVNDSALSTNVTLMGNTFNGLNQLVQLDATGALPTLDGSALTNLTGANINGPIAHASTADAFTVDPADCVAGQYAQAISANGNLTCNNDGSSLTSLNATNITAGILSDLHLSANVTLAGNTFNGANGLVQLDATGALPTLDGSALTNLTGANVTGTVANATDAVNAINSVNFSGALNGDVTGTQGLTVVSNVNDSALSTNVALLDGTNGLTFTGALSATSLAGDGSGLTSITGANVTGTVANATNAVSAVNSITADSLSADPADCTANTYANGIASNGNLTCASITDASLSTNVTLLGNTFNGANQLVQLTPGGILPVLDAQNLNNLTGGNVQGNISGNASNITGTVADANVVDSLTINGGTVDNTVIGGATAAAGTFTNLNATTLTTTGAVNANSLAVTNSATIGNALTVTGVATLNGVTTINNTLTVTGATSLSSVTISGTSTQTGAASFNGTATFNNTVTATAGINFSGASNMRSPVTATNIVDGVTNCAASGTGALTFSSTNGNFFGCDGAVWRQLN